MSNNDIETTKPDCELEKLIKDGNLHDVITDVTQLATELPLIGTLVKAMKFASATHEYIFSTKIQKFLYELKDIPKHKRQNKINEINSSPKLQYSIGLVILDQLQRIDIHDKPTILGKLFAAFCDEKFDLEDYFRLAYIVDNAFFIDLQLFQKYSQNGIYQSQDFNSLIDGELMSVDYAEIFERASETHLKDASGEPIFSSETEFNYPKLSPLGEKLLKYGF